MMAPAIRRTFSGGSGIRSCGAADGRGATTGDRLARVTAAVGLIQNFSALRALAGEGIQRGHMGLHARNVAIAAGARGEEIERVAAALIERGEIREDVARALLA